MNRSVETGLGTTPHQKDHQQKTGWSGEGNVRDLLPCSMRFNMTIEWKTPVIMLILLLSGSGPEK